VLLQLEDFKLEEYSSTPKTKCSGYPSQLNPNVMTRT